MWQGAVLTLCWHLTSHCCYLLSCSVFKPGGFMPPGTTAIEKRSIASFVPTWKSSNCTQVRRKVTAKG